MVRVGLEKAQDKQHTGLKLRDEMTDLYQGSVEVGEDGSYAGPQRVSERLLNRMAHAWCVSRQCWQPTAMPSDYTTSCQCLSPRQTIR